MKKETLISAIIVNWNVKELLRRCILALHKNIKEWAYEIIVVDNASIDDSIQMLKSEFPDVILIENKENLGFAAANNQAAKIAKGMFLLFVNPDTELQNDIQPMITYLSDDRIAAVFGKLIDPNGATQIHTTKRFPTFLNQIMELFGIAKMFPRITHFNEEERNLANYDIPHFIDWGAGAFFILKKSVFEEVGRFDEDYFVYGEEKDLFYRIKKHGYLTMFEPEIRVVHHREASTKQNPIMYLMLYQNMALFMKKNYSLCSYLLFRYCFLPIHQFLRGTYSLIRIVLTKSKNRKAIIADKLRNQLKVIRWALFG